MFAKLKSGIDKDSCRVFLLIFVVVLASKGLVIFRGYAIDDYGFIPDGNINFDLLFSQGRYIQAILIWFSEAIGANVSDIFFSTGLAALFLQAIFLTSLIRFVGLEKSPMAGIVGAIIVAHPYLTEIFTFRMAVPTYSVALVFSIFALEAGLVKPATWSSRVASVGATVAMLFTYQVFINYFAIAVVFALLSSQIYNVKDGYSSFKSNAIRQRAFALAGTSIISIVVFGLVTKITKLVGLTSGLSISKILTVDEVPSRWNQMIASLGNIYWRNEPVLSGGLKSFVALLLVFSIVKIIIFVFVKSNRQKFLGLFFAFSAFLLLAPLSLGVILPFQVWWPVPRVVAHVSVIVGLIFLLADSCGDAVEHRGVRSTLILARCTVLIGFVFLSNQILVDQQRLNQWDAMMANRMIARLEMNPAYEKVKFIYVSKGSWPWPYTNKLRTANGDMNVSGLLVDYAKVPLLAEISGIYFKTATGSNLAIGEKYCTENEPWPHPRAVAVENELAIICLKK